MEVHYVQYGDWPTADELKMFKDRVVRVRRTFITKEDNLAIELLYGCTHKKFDNITPGGRWMCGEMRCPHYVGKATVPTPPPLGGSQVPTPIMPGPQIRDEVDATMTRQQEHVLDDEMDVEAEDDFRLLEDPEDILPGDDGERRR